MRDFQIPGRSAVYAANGMCATSHPLAAGAAIDILKAGGNAVDAAIAGAVLLGFCEPQMTGLGGDCFVLFKPAGSEDIHALNGSGRAPMGLDAAALRARGLTAMPLYAPEAVTIPGAVDAFCQLSADWGRMDACRKLSPPRSTMPTKACLSPPALPRIGPRRNTCCKAAPAKPSCCNGKRPDPWANAFAPPVRPKCCAESPPKAARVSMKVRSRKIWSPRSMRWAAPTRLTISPPPNADYVTPVSGPYKGIDLYEHPPNGQGATAILLLNILSHFDIAAMDPFGADRAHIEAEATKLAYDARNRFIADPDHTTRLDHMLAPDNRGQTGRADRPETRHAQRRAPLTESVHKDTIYITVVDKDRMAVSLIYSVYHSFGACLASDKFGINFQNRGAGFTLEQGHPNEAAGGKRPMHTIIPGMIAEQGRVTMPFGVMGGAYQPCGHARLISNIQDFGMDPQSAMDAPRCFSGAEGMEVERGYSDAVRADLAARGHDVKIPVVPLGGSQAIKLHADGLLEGASDPRKDGCALGY